MDITNETELTQQAVFFGDGAHGSAHQEHNIFADDSALGVRAVAIRKSRNTNFTRSFFVDGKGYDEFKDAAIAAGHNWLKD